jgi:hypothetical protein
LPPAQCLGTLRADKAGQFLSGFRHDPRILLQGLNASYA